MGGARHSLHARPHKGSPRDPFTWPEACEKFRRYTATVLSAERATAVIDTIGRLEHVQDMAEVARLIVRSVPSR